MNKEEPFNDVRFLKRYEELLEALLSKREVILKTAYDESGIAVIVKSVKLLPSGGRFIIFYNPIGEKESHEFVNYDFVIHELRQSIMNTLEDKNNMAATTKRLMDEIEATKIIIENKEGERQVKHEVYDEVTKRDGHSFVPPLRCDTINTIFYLLKENGFEINIKSTDYPDTCEICWDTDSGPRGMLAHSPREVELILIGMYAPLQKELLKKKRKDLCHTVKEEDRCAMCDGPVDSCACPESIKR